MSFRTFEGFIKLEQEVFVSVVDGFARPLDGIYGKRVVYSVGHSLIKGSLFDTAKVIAPNIMSRW